MPFKIRFNLLLILSLITVQLKSQPKEFNKAAFYMAMADKNINQINTQLTIIKDALIMEKEAYEGALLMKKAGLLPKLKDKLNAFKTGCKKLENAIKKNIENVEFRFLRLMIQENAPRIVKYHSEIKKDEAFIRSNYKNLPQIVQQSIMDYSKKSKVLQSL